MNKIKIKKEKRNQKVGEEDKDENSRTDGDY
jgi:hypothetical protein